jgi:hypothetical protein
MRIPNDVSLMTRRNLRRAMKKKGMPTILNNLFGEDGWSYDEKERLYIAQDKQYVGVGKEYFCFNHDGDWFKARLPEGVVQ